MEQLRRRSERRRDPRRQRGLTIVELMISMTLGLLIMGALTYVYVGARATYRVNENLARLQESGRFALDYIGQDLRMVSFAGCRSRNLNANNTLMIARPAIAFTGVADGIAGFEDGAGWTNPSSVARLRGDVLVLRRAAGGGTEIAANTNAGAATVTLKNNCAGLRRGDYVVLASCERAVVFRITNEVENNCGGGVLPTVLQHAPGGAGADGSGGNGNNGIVAGSSSHQIIDTFHVDTRASVYRFDEVSYFIGANAAGQPGLYRASLNGGVEELVDNIEDIDVLYGVDTSVPPDGVADAYRRADAVANWGQVVSVRVSLLAVSPDAGIATATQTYAFRDSTGDGRADVQSAPDSRLRQVFSTTIALRNRVL
jgi:type IV pilus assembly protein PilW